MSATETARRSSSHAATGPSLQPRYAGLAGDSEGVADRRPPLLLLHGLTFDRTMWRPALDHLRPIDPGRRVLALDLPGHGESPRRSSHRLDSVVEAVHEAVLEARLEAPVVVGHSISGVIATLYAARHPTRGVINLDMSLQVAPFVERVQSLADQLRGPGFPAVWAMFDAGMHAELLPESARDLVRSTSRPGQDLVLGYWQDIFERSSADLGEWLATELSACRAARVPYLVIAGDDIQPSYREWLSEALPQAAVKVWPRSGHFPHLAHPDRFAECLAQTATWRGATSSGGTWR